MRKLPRLDEGWVVSVLPAEARPSASSAGRA